MNLKDEKERWSIVLRGGAFPLGEVKLSLDLDGDEWNRVMNTNLRGLWLMSKAVGKRMRSANIAGSIINISSTSSLERGLLVGNSAYAASKAGVNQLTKVCAYSHNLFIWYTKTVLFVYYRNGVKSFCVCVWVKLRLIRHCYLQKKRTHADYVYFV